MTFIDKNNLNLTELGIMHSQEVENKTYPETCEDLGVSRDKIKRTKKKQAYRDLVIAALDQKGATADKYAEKIIELMEAQKTIRLKGGTTVKSPDNIVQFNATSEFGDILGVKAPKEFDLKHSMAAMGDDELKEAINESVEELDGTGRIQNQITGPQNARIAVTNTVVGQQPAMAECAGEQAVSPADAGKV